MSETPTTRWATSTAGRRTDDGTVTVDPYATVAREDAVYVAGKLTRGVGLVGPEGEGRRGCVCALDRATGDLQWVHALAAPVPPRTLAVGGEHVVAAGWDHRTVHAVDPATGEAAWRHERETPVVAVAASGRVGDDGRTGDDVVVVAEADGTVAGLDAAVDQRWAASVDGEPRHLAVVGDRVVVGDDAGALTRLAADGTRRGRVDLGGAVRALAAHGDTVYAGGDDGALVAVDAADGSVGWRTTVAATVEYVAATDGGPHAVVADDGRRLVAHDATEGQRRFDREFPDAVVFHPPAVADGVAYLVDARGESGWHVLGVDAADGTDCLRWRAADADHWHARGPPVVDGDVLLVGERDHVHAIERP